MTDDPLEFVPRPRDLDRASLRELAESYDARSGALVNAEHGIGERQPVGRLRGSALDVLAISEQIRQRMAYGRWVMIRDALRYGASVAAVARALDVEPAEVIDGMTRWADGQHEHGLMSAEQRAEVLALVSGVHA